MFTDVAGMLQMRDLGWLHNSQKKTIVRLVGYFLVEYGTLHARDYQ